jgi:hypothetical protein
MGRSGPVRKCYCHKCPNCRSADWYQRHKAKEPVPEIVEREPDTGFRDEWAGEEKDPRFLELDRLIAAGK